AVVRGGLGIEPALCQQGIIVAGEINLLRGGFSRAWGYSVGYRDETQVHRAGASQLPPLTERQIVRARRAQPPEMKRGGKPLAVHLGRRSLLFVPSEFGFQIRDFRFWNQPR